MNSNRARSLYEIASNFGSAEAELRIGDLYMSGKGVPEDRVKAAEWYRKASVHGDRAAAERLRKSSPGDEPVPGTEDR